jgi:hypothetical protein
VGCPCSRSTPSKRTRETPARPASGGGATAPLLPLPSCMHAPPAGPQPAERCSVDQRLRDTEPNEPNEPNEPLNRRMCAHFPPSPTHSLDLCAHFAGGAAKSPPAHQKCAHFLNRRLGPKSAHKWTCLGEVARPRNVRTNQESGLRGGKCAHIRRFSGASGATVQQCDSATSPHPADPPKNRSARGGSRRFLPGSARAVASPRFSIRRARKRTGAWSSI